MYDLHIANKNYSSWSLRPWVLMRTLGIPFREHLIPFHDAHAWGEYRKIAPSGTVPLLRDGDVTIWDSLAITEYLAERHPRVWPADTAARAFARSAAAEMHSSFSALRNTCGMSVGVRVRLAAQPDALKANLARLSALWNQGLSSYGGPFLGGAEFSAADAFFCPVAFRVQSYGLELDAASMDYVQRLLALPAMQEWYRDGLAETFRDEPHDVEIGGLRDGRGRLARQGKQIGSAMPGPKYQAPIGGHPPQTDLLTGRAVFTEAYAFIPHGVMREIVTSALPFWERTKVWVLARPLSGFSETFSQYVMEVAPGGGSDRPEPDQGAEGVLFVMDGDLSLTVDGQAHRLQAGGYAFLPPASRWTVRNGGASPVRFHWVRKRYEKVEGLDIPEAFVRNEQDVVPMSMPGTAGRWATTRFVDPDDLRHDMHVNIVTLEPGAVIPFMETHVMEHGLYVLEGKAVYKLNKDWVEVQAGDFMWLRAFCPQACYAGGPGKFRYLLYKDVNRHMKLGGAWSQ